MKKAATLSCHSYDLPKTISFKNQYLKETLQRGVIDINSKLDYAKILKAQGTKLQTLKLFFFKYLSLIAARTLLTKRSQSSQRRSSL